MIHMSRILFGCLRVAGGLLIISAAMASERIPSPPATRPGKTISLQEAIHQAQAHNKSLKTLRLNLTIASEQVRTSWAGLLPQVYGQLGYTLHDSAQTTTDESGQQREIRPRQEVQASLTAVMPLVNATVWLGTRNAQAKQKIAELDYQQARQLLLYTVAETYYQAATTQRLIRVYANQAKALLGHLTDAKSRYRSGTGELMDVKRAQTDLVSIRESQASAIFSLEDDRDLLALLIGSALLPLPLAEPGSVPFAEDPTPSQPRSLSARWDLALARQALSLAQKEFNTEYMQFVPTLQAQFHYALNINTPDFGISDDQSRWFAGLVLQLPLFDFSFYPAIGLRRAAVLQAQHELEDIQAKAETEWKQTARMIYKAQYFLSVARTKTKLADDTFALARIAYTNGATNALTVIDAQRSSQSAHEDYQTRRLELELARLAYLRAIGQDVAQLFNALR